jgi:adenylylsulfate kinase
MIILMAGLPGTGKSTLAQALAQELRGSVLSKDAVRHALFAPEDIEYSAEQDDFCVEVMLETAGYVLRKDPNRFIFLDGRTFSRQDQVKRILDFASEFSQQWRIIECTCSQATVKNRLSTQNGHPAGNRDFELYLEVKARFEPITQPKIVVDTDQPLESCIAQCLQALA